MALSLKNKLKKIATVIGLTSVAAVATVAVVTSDSNTQNSVDAATVTQLRGINRAGAEYGSFWDGWNGQTYYEWPSAAVRKLEFDHYQEKGMNLVRLPISWERLQHELLGPLDATYQAKLQEYVADATSRGLHVVIDLHNYGRYAQGAFDASGKQTTTYKQLVLGDGLLYVHISDVWKKLASLFVDNPLVVFNIMNEQHDAVNLTGPQIFGGYQEALDAIRSTGAKQLVLFPSSRSADVGHWTTWSPQGGGLDSVNSLVVHDSANNFAFDMHTYQEYEKWLDDVVKVTEWARANDRKLFMSEFGADTSTASSSIPALLAYLNANSDVWLGWAPWNIEPYSLMETDSASASIKDTYRMKWFESYYKEPATSPAQQADASTDASIDASLRDSGQAQPSQGTGTTVTTPTSYQKEKVFTVNSGTTNWVYVPKSYDATHKTPTKLFVWLHGCGGQSEYDVYMVSPGGDQDWISLTVGGREKQCWSDVSVDGSKVLAAIADIKTRFNIDTSRVFLGGYSSGGDIGYPLLFANANMFAGGLFENTGPSTAAMNAAKSASWKLNIVHLAHQSDTVYPIATIRSQMSTLKNQGFNVVFVEKPGNHWDDDTGSYGTSYDLNAVVLPYLKGTWSAPSGTATQPPPECSYAYSAWSDCQPSGTQTRTAVGSPSGCVGNPVVMQGCTYVPPSCVYVYSAWSACMSDNKQSRSVTSSSPAGCAGTPSLTQACTYVPPKVDTDGDGIVDALDKCPKQKGVASKDPSRNGCEARLTVVSKITYDWTTGYCEEFYLENQTTAWIAWSSATIDVADGKLRGKGNVWGLLVPNESASGTVKGKPATWTSPVEPGTTATIGLCADVGKSKKKATLSTLSY